MIFLVENLVPSLLASVALGMACAAFAMSAGPVPAYGRVVLGLALVALTAGWGVSLLQLVPGKAGLWLDVGVLLGAGFAAGTCLGVVARRVAARWRRA